MAKKDDTTYRTYQYFISDSHELFSYCDDMCFKSKNMYNVTNFYIRQFMTGLKKEPLKRTKNENDVIDLFETHIKEVNAIRIRNGNTPYEMPTESKWFVKKFLVDGVLKVANNIDYYSLPAQTNQYAITDAFNNWKSYFKSLAEYKKHPEKFEAMPRIPRYAKKNGRKPCKFTNQTSIIKMDSDGFPVLKLPLTKQTLKLGNSDSSFSGKHKETRIIPQLNGKAYVIEVVFSVRRREVKTKHKRIAAIDLGVGNIAAISNNIGLRPFIIKGGIPKSANQWYNKQVAHYDSILRMGHESEGNTFNSRRLVRIRMKRKNQIKDFFHKTSRKIVEYCVFNNIDTIVIGKNDGWKQESDIGRQNNQNFVQLPHSMLINMIQYKAEAEGIEVIVNEESYTSRASFIDRDFIPVFSKDNNEKYKFSGVRLRRGLYRTKEGILLNADVNGSYNILRKVFPNGFEEPMADRGIRDMPAVVTVV